ncbi:SAV0927 family protein [Gracilibacillus xinjiangensis]|uniref:SAV0927 family protein n=1 Tax=Gracilibacillus xinjiangensis TaxID=1193282 RepID=A0ABV8WZB4_9BACI
MEISYIKNEMETSQTRLVSFKGNTIRFDLAIISSPAFKPDYLVIDLNTNRYCKLQAGTLVKENYVEHAFQYNEMEAEDFKTYVKPLISEIT